MIRNLFFFIGLLLTLTAIGKFWQLFTDPFADIRSGYPTIVLWLGAFVELGVVWLLTSRAEVPVKLTALIGLFSIFSVVSLGRWLTGNSSCGCAGSLEIAPWISTLMSCVVIGLLVWAGNSWKKSNEKSIIAFWRQPWSQNTTAGILGFAGLVSVGIVFAIFGQPLLPSAFSSIGDSVKAPPRLDIGNVKAGSVVTSEVEFENSSDRPVFVLGSQSSCVCVFGQNEKIEIPANGSAMVPIIVEPRDGGTFYNRIVFFLDSPDQKTVSVNLSGFVSSSL